jgi:hypothetical protein
VAPLKPERGLVIRYDFLWRNEERAGRQDGSKDRPCAIVLTRDEQPDGSVEVFVCAITHTPPGPDDGAVEIPAKVLQHLGLDVAPSWIKTSEVNAFTWEKDQLPFGMTRTPKDEWSYGFLPPDLYRQMRDRVVAHSRRGRLRQVRRD